MLDEYFWGEIERISPEAPVPVLQLRRSEYLLGGAANVARNMASMGAQVRALGLVGKDTAATTLLDALDEAGIDRECVLLESGRPTTRKCRLMSMEHGQQVFRFDMEVTEEIPADIEDQLLMTLREQIGSADAVICSDYRKGVLTPRVLREIAAMARQQGIAQITAPKDTNAEKYAGATVLMPNLREFAVLAGERMGADISTWLDRAATRLLGEYGFEALLVTRGRDGMTLFEQTAGGTSRERHCVDDAKRLRRDGCGGHGPLCVWIVPRRRGTPRSGSTTCESGRRNSRGETWDRVRNRGRNPGTDRQAS